jgi:hypothetical protein
MLGYLLFRYIERILRMFMLLSRPTSFVLSRLLTIRDASTEAIELGLCKDII